MQIYGGINPYASQRFGFSYIDTILKQEAVTNASNQIRSSNDRAPSLQSYEQVMRIREAVQAIKPMMIEPQEVQVASPASATSDASLSLDGAGAPTTVQSTAEVNTTPTSYSTHGPDWTGASTAQVTISGEYDGTNGTDTLTFEATRGGTHGAQNLQIKVYNSNMVEIDSININKKDPIDQQYTLSNGLVLTLGGGDLVKNDTFTLDVSDSVGTAVDPDNPFNGTRNSDPDLEPGLSVSDGSFQINGTSIDVNASDSINSVLDRINQSDAGVTATFEAASETVLLTQNTAGSSPDILLENDTSGFLAAVKLDAATPTPGEDPETDQALAQVATFSTVQSGSISINGVSIDIDVNTDSLNDVLDRISASEAAATASFNSASQKVSLNADNTGSPLILSGGATNFFSSVDISEGTYNSKNDSIEGQSVSTVDVANLVVDSIVEENSEKPWEIQTSEAAAVTAADARILGSLVHNIADAMNALFDDRASGGSSNSFLEGVRSGIRSAVSTTLGSEGPQFNTDFGIRIDFEKTDKGVFNFSRADQSQFETALSSPDGYASVRNTLFGTESDGLFSQLQASLTAAATGLETDVGTKGMFLNLSI